MAVALRGRHFLKLLDFSPQEIRYLLDLARRLKAERRSGVRGQRLAGSSIALLFEKPSTRTRCAFTVACVDEGAHPEHRIGTAAPPFVDRCGAVERSRDTGPV